jgi:uncharacterized Fe-S center protein
MNKVYFTESDKKMLERLDKELREVFKIGDRIAVKLHMGEVYNPNHISPEFVKKIVTLLKKIGTEPFLFDSPTLYGGPRHTSIGYKAQAALLGFREGSVGCPVVVSDEYVVVKGKHMSYQVCKPLADTDGVLVLSHFKGHACASMGGAIKNLGMGALTKKSKGEIHEGGKPELKGKCGLCHKCLEVCPQKCIKYDESGPVFSYGSCYGCSKCMQNCPAKCLKPRIAEFDTLLADGAVAAQKKFKKFYYVNVLRRITNVCDCSQKDVHIVCPDIGIVMGRDACAVDSASVDLVNKRMGKDLFLELWHKDPKTQIAAAEKLDMGSSEYEMEEDWSILKKQEERKAEDRDRKDPKSRIHFRYPVRERKKKYKKR